MPPEAFLWLIVLWMFAMGAAVGSFLNVVVYRLPLGISLVYPPSHCPKCGKRIPWYDNVPIFGWIILRGRCRQCHNPISARYPIVEALTATMFALLAVVEMNRLDTLYPLHLLLLCTLLCASLIEFDGHRPPTGLFLPALAAGIVAMWFCPWLLPQKVSPWSLPAPWGLTIVILTFLSIPVLCGAVWLAARDFMARLKPPRLGIAWSVVCLTLALDWQAGPIIGIATLLYLLLAVVGRLLPRLRFSLVMALTLVAFVWIVAWATFGS
jgi:prepilin signal peptidase PulO-like enzyme (type II secretory pathway)